MSQNLRQMLSHISPGKSTDVLEYVTTVFQNQPDVLAHPHVTLLSKIAEEVLDEASLDIVSQSAEVFADIGTTPRSLILKLANEKIEIAAPVLQRSIVLSDNDLVSIISAKSEDHQQSIAQRNTLTDQVSTRLIETGNVAPISTLIQNTGAQISRIGYSQIAQIAHRERSLIPGLSKRKDVPKDIATALVRSLKASRGKPLNQAVPAGQPNRQSPPQPNNVNNEGAYANLSPIVQEYIRDIEDKNVSLNEAVTILSNKNKDGELCQLLSVFSKLADSSISKTLFKLNGTKIAQICKALDLSSEAFAALCEIRTKRMRLPLAQTEILRAQYKTIPLISAKRALKAMQVRSARTEERSSQFSRPRM